MHSSVQFTRRWHRSKGVNPPIEVSCGEPMKAPRGAIRRGSLGNISLLLAVFWKGPFKMIGSYHPGKQGLISILGDPSPPA